MSNKHFFSRVVSLITIMGVIGTILSFIFKEYDVILNLQKGEISFFIAVIVSFITAIISFFLISFLSKEREEQKHLKYLQERVLRSEVSKKQREIKDLHGKIENLKKQYSLGAKIKFVFNNYDAKTLSDTIEEMLKNVKNGETVRAVGFMDGKFSREIINMLKIGKLRVICREWKKGQQDVIRDSDKVAKFLNELLYEYSNSIGIKLNSDLHCRMLIIGEREVLISTADLVTELDIRKDAGVWTNDPILIGEAIKFFNKCYESKNSKIYHPSKG